jgi:hypothetical protein
MLGKKPNFIGMHNSFKRHVLVVTLLFLTALAGCRKGYDFRNATLLGYDLRLCAVCCGGLVVKIDGETNPYSSYFIIKNKPSEFGIDLNTVFPINVKLAWVPDSSPSQCLDNIEVIAWEKR